MSDIEDADWRDPGHIPLDDLSEVVGVLPPEDDDSPDDERRRDILPLAGEEDQAR
jgi:hypothetical protein